MVLSPSVLSPSVSPSSDVPPLSAAFPIISCSAFVPPFPPENMSSATIAHKIKRDAAYNAILVFFPIFLSFSCLFFLSSHLLWSADVSVCRRTVLFYHNASSLKRSSYNLKFSHPQKKRQQTVLVYCPSCRSSGLMAYSVPQFHQVRTVHRK